MSEYTKDLIEAKNLVTDKSNIMIAEIQPHEFIELNEKDHKISFIIQNGPKSEFGRNGCQITDVLLFVKEFINLRNKAFPCRENSITITKLEEALMWQEKRTNDRAKRDVEGKDLK